MSIGANSGGNLNILVFEVGLVATVEAFGVQAELVSTVSIHPMVVSPSSWGWNDTSRSAVVQTAGGSALTVAGRALRSGNFEGTFGVESRGIAFYIGNGDMRLQRFYKEVVRMGEAMDAEQVDAAVDWLNGTPGIALLVAPYDEDTCTFFVNVYDFWNDLSFQCRIGAFQWRRTHNQGGASGLVHYSMRVDEVGPLVEGGLGSTVLSALMAVLTTWDDINDVIGSYTLDVIIGSIAAVGAIILSEFADTLEAVQAQIDGVQACMGGTSSGRSSTTTGSSDGGLGSYMEQTRRLQRAAEDLAARTATARPTAFRAEVGRVRWESQTDEGGSPALATFEAITGLLELASAALAQESMGVFYGMDREAYQAFIASGGASTTEGPDVQGSLSHVVTDTDTPDTIATAYAVAWDRILAVNRLTPHEALLVGTVLSIPKVRPTGQQGIDGLPTFGSHLGQSAWGVDLALDFDVDTDGDLLKVSGPDVLLQGATWIAESFGDDILKAAQSVPEGARARYLAKRFAGVFRSDERVQSVSDVQVVTDPGGLVDVAVTINAINGGTVRSAGR